MTTVEIRPDELRYVLLDDGAEIGEESYVDTGKERVVFHTYVADTHSGKGLASVLVRAALNDIVERGMKIVPVCPYVKAWLPKHPEYAEHVVEPTRAHLRAISDRGNPARARQ
jgi:predicted GNAT family acetyltransferase